MPQDDTPYLIRACAETPQDQDEKRSVHPATAVRPQVIYSCVSPLVLGRFRCVGGALAGEVTVTDGTRLAEESYACNSGGRDALPALWKKTTRSRPCLAPWLRGRLVTDDIRAGASTLTTLSDAYPTQAQEMHTFDRARRTSATARSWIFTRVGPRSTVGARWGSGWPRGNSAPCEEIKGASD
jgi:hypothetical protein